METQQLENVQELLKLAGERVNLPPNYLEIKYYEDVDLLAIRFTDTPATRSKGDLENGLVFNYDSQGKLTSIEVLDFYGVYAEA